MAERVLSLEQVLEFLRSRAYPIEDIPTLRNLQSIFGGGSLATISKGVAKYKAELEDQRTCEIPQAFHAVFAEVERQAWKVAGQKALEAAQVARLQADQERTEIDKQIVYLESANAEKAAKILSLQNRLKQLTSSEAQAWAQVTVVKDEMEDLKLKIAEQTRCIIDLEVAKGKAEAALAAFKEASAEHRKG